ncbi:hypothetical protein BKK49_11275 [Rodentibacter rarus]|uniref:Phage protein n=1 Tax=Rodentibacter rarus TaxID=1908260 RepID=A0A1V3IFA4_9PAST|nr:hypothetical protein [Rodentibacter rarus]OOF37446.1 hypothetical protein BKK49_11275 [Rodentibacter rarus]OOF38976.1 hypothetical protein BKK50_11130 [Rodentibacter rarus]
MSKNKLQHLNDHLFATLERLNEEGLNSEQIDAEIKRSKAVADVSSQIIDIARVSLEAEKLKADYLGKDSVLPAYFDYQPPTALEVKNAN